MNSLKSLIAIALLLIGSAPTVANAAPISTTTFAFSGLCDDCAGALVGSGPFHALNDGVSQSVTGTLVLQNFVPGVALDISNFSSFTYNGSSILLPFTVSGGTTVTGLAGSLDASGTVLSTFALNFLVPTPPGLTTTGGLFFCGACVFAVLPDGQWVLAQGTDRGTNGVFSLAPIPEPGSLALSAVALAGLAGMRRRRST